MSPLHALRSFQSSSLHYRRVFLRIARRSACLAAIASGLGISGASADSNFYRWGQAALPASDASQLVALEAGNQFTVGLKSDGSLIAWGINNNNIASVPAGIDFQKIAAGYGHALALRNDGSIVGWGANASGETSAPAGGPFKAIAAGRFFSVAVKSNGSLVVWGSGASTTLIPPSGTDFVAVAAGLTHAVALRIDGSIAVWGNNSFGQLSNAPTGFGYAAISAKGDFSLALTFNGTIVGWGLNSEGQTNVPSGTGYKAISAGGGHGLAVDSTNAIVAWGSNDRQQAVAPSGAFYKNVSAGSYHSVAILTDDSFAGWGWNYYGEAQRTPLTGYVDISSGPNHDLAVRSDGSIVGFGNDGSQPGAPPDTTINPLTPPAGAKFKSAAAGSNHSVGLKLDDSLAAWGANFNGETTVPGGTTYAAVAAGDGFSLALKKDGSIVGWGRNESGQTTTPSGTDFVAIAASANHALALKTDGSIVGWGTNALGAATPPAGTDFKAIATGPKFSLGLKTDGSIVSWGQAPSALGLGTGNKAIAVGNAFGVAVGSTGAIKVWGSTGGGISSYPAGTLFTKVTASLTNVMALAAVGPPPPPTVTITAPLPGVIKRAGINFAVRAIVTGDTSQVQRVVIKDSNVVPPLGTFGAPPYVVANYYPTSDGWTTLSATAELIDGSIIGSDNVSIYRPLPVEECFLEIVAAFYAKLAGASLHTPATTQSINPPQTPPMAAAVSAIDLALLRRFRDEVLSTTPAGRYYTDLYNRTSDEMITTVAVSPTQLLAIYQALVDWTPAIQAMVNHQGGTVQITPAMVTQAQSVLTNLRALATGNLATIMDAETTALNPSTWSSLTAAGLLTRVESQVRPAPGITTHPLTQSLTAGGVLTLSVVASGAGPFTYQWLRSNVAITGATSATYTVPSAQRFHAGDYTVKVTNPFATTTSNTATFAVSAPTANAARLMNLSTRALCLTGNDVLIPGFVVGGTGTKRVLIRAVGPTLAGFGVAGTLPNPRMTVKRFVSGAFADYANNDDWSTNTNAAAIVTTSAQVFAFPLGAGSLDSALLLDLPVGQYTVVTSDVTDQTGVAIVELYDTETMSSGARLDNISNRGFVGTGGNIMIPGFVVSSEGAKTLLVRAVGPGLTQFGVSGVLADPQLTIFYRPLSGGTDTAILSNDNWGDSPDAANTVAVAAQIFAFALPAGSKDAAFVVTLPPGIYSVQASGVGGATGVALVEVYVVP